MYEEAFKNRKYIMLSISITSIGIQEQEFYRTADSKQLVAARV